MYSKEIIEKAVKSKGYVWFNSGKDYDLNIVGIRNTKNGDVVSNLFDDLMTLSYQINGNWYYHEWHATTDPGKYYVMNPIDHDGVAILVPNQYRGSHATGLHRGKYEALVQVKDLKVWRDNDKDMTYDHLTTEVGEFGINIHRSAYNGTAYTVDNYSAGCMVFAAVGEFNTFMDICRHARDVWGNHFTFTLITTDDMVL